MEKKTFFVLKQTNVWLCNTTSILLMKIWVLLKKVRLTSFFFCALSTHLSRTNASFL